MITVLSTFQDGTDRRWLHRYGVVDGWTHKTTWPGGPTEATFTFFGVTDFRHPALRQGRLVQAYSGTNLVWSGRLEQPKPGVPWACSATGISALGAGVEAYDPTLFNAYNLNSVVDNAISLGLPWTRPGSLQQPAGGAANASKTVADVLGELVRQGGWWNVTEDGVITTGLTAAWTAPKYFLFPLADPPGQTLGGYCTRAVVTYTSSVDHTYHTYSATASADIVQRDGVIVRLADLTGSGEIAPSDASNAASRLLAAAQTAGYAWDGPFTAMPGELRDQNGVPIYDLSSVHAGCTVTVFAPGLPHLGATFVAGEVDYDDTTGAAALTPAVSQRDDVAAVLARR